MIQGDGIRFEVELYHLSIYQSIVPARYFLKYTLSRNSTTNISISVIGTSISQKLVTYLDT